MLMKNSRLFVVIAVLAVATLSLSYLNMKYTGALSPEEGSISFVFGESQAKLDYNDITSLTAYEFRAVEDTSTSGPTPHTYKGVLLKDVLNKASISDEAVKTSSKVVVRGLDGYVVALSTDDVLSDKNVYLAFEKDGKPLGSMKNGGSGPFQLIARSDSFSQRWCKYVIEVTLE